MSRAALISGVLALCLAGCAQNASVPPEPMGVADAAAQIEALNGRTVSVRGWLTDPCGKLSCAIFPMPTAREQNWPQLPYLSIAAGTLVEPDLKANAGHEVILRGVLSSECRKPYGRCMDRAADITPVRLQALNSQRPK